MATKVDLYIAHGGKADAGSSSGGNSARQGDDRFGGRKEKLGVAEESPQLDSVMTIVEKKKLRAKKRARQRPRS